MNIIPTKSVLFIVGYHLKKRTHSHLHQSSAGIQNPKEIKFTEQMSIDYYLTILPQHLIFFQLLLSIFLFNIIIGAVEQHRGKLFFLKYNTSPMRECSQIFYQFFWKVLSFNIIQFKVSTTFKQLIRLYDVRILQLPLFVDLRRIFSSRLRRKKKKKIEILEAGFPLDDIIYRQKTRTPSIEKKEYWWLIKSSLIEQISVNK